MEQIAAAKIKIYEFPEVILLPLPALLKFRHIPNSFFALFQFVVFQVEDGEEAERKENRRMKVRFYQKTRLPSNRRS